MTANHATAPVRVRILAIPASSAAVVYGMHEVLAAVGAAWEMMTGQPAEARRMVPEIVSPTNRTFRTDFGATITPDYSFADAGPSDVVIVPYLTLAAGADLNIGKDVVDWIRNQFADGATVCSVCTGSLLLAEAGLLDGIEATTHWSATPVFATRYPEVRLHPERILSPAGPEHRIVTSGGAASWTDLMLYLVARYAGTDEARRIAKVFLFGDRNDGQLPFAALARPKQHDDFTIADCQTWIASHYEEPNPVASLIARSGLAPRTFARRFRQATGYSPIEYVQTLRIEEAKQMLESTDQAIDEVAADVGYDDAGAFRRLFKRLTGVSPAKYRQRFGLASAYRP